MPLYGHELSEQIDPITAGLDFAVNLNGRNFIGSDALLEKSNAPQSKQRIGLKLTGRRAAREGAIVLNSDGRTIGQVTSGTFSPTLELPIAMAYIDCDAASLASQVAVDIRGSKVDATVAGLPFYKRPEPVTQKT